MQELFKKGIKDTKDNSIVQSVIENLGSMRKVLPTVILACNNEEIHYCNDMQRKLKLYLAHKKEKVLKHNQNFVIHAIIKGSWARAVAVWLNKYLHINKKQLYLLVSSHLEPFVIAEMDNLKFIDNNLITYLNNYIKKTPVYLVERKLNQIH